MTLDRSTLFLVLIGLCLVAGVGMVMRLRAYPGDRYLVYWSAALLSGACALIGLAMRDWLPGWATIVAANALAFVAFSLAWNGLRVFGGRRPLWWPLAIGLAIWFGACAVPEFYASPPYRVALASVLTTIASLMLVAEVLRNRTDQLRARVPLAALCGIHAAATALRAVVAFVDGRNGVPDVSGTFYSIGLFEPIFILFGVIVTGLSMTQQRRELALTRKAAHDTLTGLLNRGAFMEQAEALLLDARARHKDVALLAFDIDFFKDINDRFGHAAGDRALVAFGDAARHVLREGDLAGRLGGEEFAVLLVGVKREAAALIAERIRSEFSRRTADLDGVAIAATACAGVSASTGAVMAFEALMIRADEALYAAKRAGRDLVRHAAE